MIAGDLGGSAPPGPPSPSEDRLPDCLEGPTGVEEEGGNEGVVDPPLPPTLCMTFA